MVLLMPFGARKARGPSSFYLGYLSIKNLNHIAKDANIFHLKANNSYGQSISQLPPFHNTPPTTTTNSIAST
jgi:hypothetical protein